jgi:SAM-dependent methyltransferase
LTGLDFSPAALEQGRRLAAATGLDVEFVESDLYGAPEALGERRFDLVYTGIGAICWLPDIRRWAHVVAALLRPGGRLFMREGHPVLWSIAEPRPDGLLVLDFPYFEQQEAMVWEVGGTYVATDAVFTHNTTHEWNHGLGEIVSALLAEGLELTMLEEHDSVPWEALPGQMTDIGDGEFRLTDRPERLPHSYTLQAVKRRS